MVESDDDLIKKWKTRRDQNAYRALKNRHKGLVHQMVNRYAAASLPRQALEVEAWKLFDDAVTRYQPSSGAKFSTFLSYQLRRVDRYAKKHQNVARIPEALSARIGDYDRANQALSMQLGRQPTQKELSKQLGMPLKHVQQLHKSRRGDLFENRLEENSVEVLQRNANMDWLLKELRDELNDQERMVYDHLIGYQKVKITNKRALATKLGMSPGRVSQITSSIAKKLQPHLKRNL